jgi:hypothetical protein
MALTDKALKEFFTAAARQLGITTPHPILSVWKSQAGTFCFVEFRGVQDAKQCMSLMSGLTLGGRPLRVGRPADYRPLPPHLENYMVEAPALPAANAMLEQAQKNLMLKAATGVAGTAGSEGGKVAPTPIILLLNMVTPEELVEDEEYEDIRNQVGEECEKFGRVLAVVVPRPNDQANQAAVMDEDDAIDEDDDDDDEGPDQKKSGVGRIFIKYASIEEAKEAHSKLDGRQFGGNQVEARYYPVDKFEAKQYAE